MEDKKRSLEQQIETIVEQDSIDSEWHDHFDVVAEALTTVGRMPDLSLLDPDSAKQAVVVCNAKLSKLNQVLKQVRAVKMLAEQKRAEGDSSIDLDTTEE